MQLRSRSTEPETLRIHREMYERRLRDMETSCGSEQYREVDAANSPVILEHSDGEAEEDIENAPTKAALAHH